MSVSLQTADKKTHCGVSQMVFLEEISHSALSIDCGLLASESESGFHFSSFCD